MTTRDENGNRQIRHKLLIVLPTMAVMAVGILYLFGYFQTRMVALHPEADEFEAHTEAASSQLDQLVDNAMGDLQSVSVRAAEKQGRIRDADLAELAEQSEFFRRLALYDTFGTRMAGSVTCVPAEGPFAELLQEALMGMPVMSAPTSSQASQQDQCVFALYPIVDSLGQPLYVLCGELSMQTVWAKLNGENGYEDAVMALLDDTGKVLLPPGEELSEEIAAVEPPVDGVEAGKARGEADSQFFYVAREARTSDGVGGPSWTVLMMKPVRHVTALIDKHALINSLTALVTLGLLSLVGISMNRRVYMPLESAVEAAGRVAKGQLNVAVPEEGPTEVRKIAEAINHMAAEVRYHRSTLNNMVKTRTETLETARRALEQNMEHLQASYDSAQDAVLIVDVINGEILQANKQLEELFEFEDVDISALTGRDFCAALREMFVDAVDFQNRWEYYSEHPDAEGTEEWTLIKPRKMVLSVYTASVRSGDERAIMGRLWTFKDVTEQREMEEKLRQSQKMDAMSHLAGSLAHDFNNLLTVILGNLSIARMEVGESDDVQSFLEAAEGATNEATDLVKQLLGFSDRSRLQLATVNLNGIVEKVKEVLDKTADPRINVEVELSQSLWDVPADASQLEQVIMNLCMNAVDALPNGGKIRVRSENVVLKLGEHEMPPNATAGEYVRLVVEDDGVGMSSQVQDRIFEPFYTTKGQAGSQGLGLAMAYGAVNKHGGWITCESESGKGATFSAYLQRAEQRSEPMKVEHKTSEDTGQSHRVLVVDDEAGVRRIATSVLKRGGFETTEACDGEEAINYYQDHGSEVSAVLLDLSMPKLSGRETFIALKQMDPDVPVILCSGYPISLDEFAGETGFRPNGTIQKPFNVMDLCDKVRELLNPAHAGVAG